MSINPVLANDTNTGELLPNPLPGESFITKRDNIWFEARLPSGLGKITAKGVFFFTSERLVFIAQTKKSRDDFNAFEIKLRSMKKYSFEQPIFGANYLEVHVNAEGESDTMAGNITTYLSFYHGGCGTFLTAFFRIMKEIEKQSSQNKVMGIISDIQNAGQSSQAYSDANDPTVVYYQQPVVVGIPVAGGVPAGATARPVEAGESSMEMQPSAPPVVTGVPVQRK